MCASNGYSPSRTADDHVVSLSLLKSELVDSSPDPLLGVVSDRAGVGENHGCLLDVLSEGISRILKDRENDLAVIDVHLTSVGLYIYLRPRRVDNRFDAVHFF